MPKTVENITGAKKVTAVFGHWPSFHDAELLSLRLERSSHRDGCHGPTLDALVHAFEMTSEVGADGCYVLRHHVLIHLRFLDVVELEMNGFNHQNALAGLALTDLRDRQMEHVRWAVRFDGSFGVEASFQCYEVEVVSVTPCDKAGEPLQNQPGA